MDAGGLGGLPPSKVGGSGGAEPPSSMADWSKYDLLIFGRDWNGMIFGLERTGTDFLDRNSLDRTGPCFWNGDDFGIYWNAFFGTEADLDWNETEDR